jgi:dTDP-4-amino-4,6-dideoxygalactose transaminase
MKLYSLPSAGHPIGLSALFKALSHSVSDHATAKQLFPTTPAMSVSSGSAALWMALKSFSRVSPRKKVILPAYTCPSLVSAVLNAGLQPVLCDLDYPTFSLNLDDLQSLMDRDTLAVIAVHLFGHGERIDQIKQIAHASGAYLLEDAAQIFITTSSENSRTAYRAASPQRDGRPEAGRGDLTVISFGRGKPISLLNGGAVLVNRTDLLESLMDVHRRIPLPDTLDRSVYIAKLMAYAVLFHPRLFWLPQSLPFLKIGETCFNPYLSCKKQIPLADRLGTALLPGLRKAMNTRTSNSRLYLDKLRSMTDHFDYIPGEALRAPIRLPLIFQKPHLRDRCLEALNLVGMGASRSYPCPLNRLTPNLNRLLGDALYPNALRLSERILTLPTHENVKKTDIALITAVMLSIFS